MLGGSHSPTNDGCWWSGLQPRWGMRVHPNKPTVITIDPSRRTSHWVTSWWFQHNWKIWVKLDHLHRDRGEKQKCLSCHHLGYVSRIPKFRGFPSLCHAIQEGTTYHIHINLGYIEVLARTLHCCWSEWYQETLAPFPPWSCHRFPPWKISVQLEGFESPWSPWSLLGTYIHIWVFPKIMVPPNHPILIGCSIINHPFGGTPIFRNIHIFMYEMYTLKVHH